jgi:hypothetical protein
MTRSAADRLDILDLLASADNAATRRDVTSYVACFTDDAVLDGSMGEHRGKSGHGGGCRADLADRRRHERPPHHERRRRTGLRRDDRAVAHSVLVILANAPVTVHSISNITHHLVKESAGWRVARRTVQPLLGTSA